MTILKRDGDRHTQKRRRWGRRRRSEGEEEGENEENRQLAYVLPGFRVNIGLYDPAGASEHLVNIFCTQHDRLNASENQEGNKNVSFL